MLCQAIYAFVSLHLLIWYLDVLTFILQGQGMSTTATADIILWCWCWCFESKDWQLCPWCCYTTYKYRNVNMCYTACVGGPNTVRLSGKAFLVFHELLLTLGRARDHQEALAAQQTRERHLLRHRQQ